MLCGVLTSGLLECFSCQTEISEYPSKVLIQKLPMNLYFLNPEFCMDIFFSCQILFSFIYISFEANYIFYGNPLMYLK